MAASRFGCIRQDLFENEEIYEEIEGIPAELTDAARQYFLRTFNTTTERLFLERSWGPARTNWIRQTGASL